MPEAAKSPASLYREPIGEEGPIRDLKKHPGLAELADTTQTLKVKLSSKLFQITVDGVGRVISLSAIASLTVLGGLYLYLMVA